MRNSPKPKFAVDYDGVIVDTNSIKAEWIKTNLALDIPSWRCDHTSLVPEIMDERQHEKMAIIVYGKDWSLKAQSIPGAIDGLHTLNRIGNIYIVTARSSQTVRWVREWLKLYELENIVRGVISTEYPSKRTKKDICIKSGFHLLIDDDMGWANDFADLEIPIILFKSGLPQCEQENTKSLLPPRIECVNSWEEIINFVKKMEWKYHVNLRI